MKYKRVDEYHKHGYHSSGKLVVINYIDDVKNDPNYNELGIDLSTHYIQAARTWVNKYYGKHNVLVAYPEYVAELTGE